jgi:preprotein translocase subunit SecE
LKDVQLELKKVNWPSKKETLRYTLIVILVSAFVAAFLGGLDFVFTKILERFILS